MPSPAIWWLRRDLRLADNVALATALAGGGAVVPVFVLDPALLASRFHADAERRRAFLFAGLAALDGDLRARGGRLVVRTGRPADVLRAIVDETRAARVVAEEDYSPYARRRDAAVARRVPLALVPGVAVHHPRDVVKQDGGPYAVYGAFARAWRAAGVPSTRDVLPPPDRLPAPPALASDAIPAATDPPLFPAGEAEAQRRLARFTRGPLARYADARDRLDLDGTSTLSPYLRFGMLSARTAVATAAAAGRRGSRGAGRWLGELVWREFYLAVLWHVPDVLRRPFDERVGRIRWRHAPEAFRAWCDGRTGYPIVDAAMRQLAATGWIHNRARMIVASFLVKDLLIDWRAGERWFQRTLVDGDPAANDGNWQWVAGTGADAAPYFRIFNPVLQGRRFDPDGDYVRRWVPELAGVRDAAVHEPWELDRDPGRTYPPRIVDHDEARARALAAYARARDQSTGI